MGVTEQTAEALYERIFHVVEAEPLTINDQDIDLSITLGSVHFPLHGRHAGLLLRNAEGALYTAKQNQKRWIEYKPEHTSQQRDQLSMLGELRRALEHNEIHLFFQPQVSIASGRLVQAEALVRWSHPERGWIPPNDFIPFLEKTGRIRSLTNWVLNAVAKQVAAWRAEGNPLTVALNVAVHDLEDPDFAQRVAFALQQHQAMAGDVCLEITEGGLMADPEQALITLSALHQAGHPLAVDDFGTGYSSLAHLSKLPVDELKIDRSFIMDWNPQNRSIVVSTISLGHALQMKVVAEGVETAAQYRELAALGCDIAQGYLVSKPLPLAEFDRWRAAHQGEYPWGG
jgi:EAL domain-containing protein (putative c-di-GMP-specific phosphodiesterase class I)